MQPLLVVALFAGFALVGAAKKGVFGLVCGIGLALLIWAKGLQLVNALREQRDRHDRDRQDR